MIFGSGTDPILLFVAHLVVFLVGGNTHQKRLSLYHFKSDWDEIWQDCYCDVNTHQVTESDF